MTDKSVHRRVRHWARQPDQAMKYGPWARASDWLCAVRDARSGLPELLMPADEHESGGRSAQTGTGQILATPRILFLGQLGRGRAEKAWIRYQAEVADIQILLTQARTRHETAISDLSAAKGRLAKLATPGKDDLGQRLSGEEQTDTAVLNGRRLREFGERRHALEDEVRRAGVVASECGGEVARLEQIISTRFEVVRTQAEIIDAYIRRRGAAYLTKLTRKHPQGKQLGGLVQSTWPEQPRWSSWNGLPDGGSSSRPVADISRKVGDT